MLGCSRGWGCRRLQSCLSPADGAGCHEVRVHSHLVSVSPRSPGHYSLSGRTCGHRSQAEAGAERRHRAVLGCFQLCGLSVDTAPLWALITSSKKRGFLVVISVRPLQGKPLSLSRGQNAAVPMFTKENEVTESRRLEICVSSCHPNSTCYRDPLTSRRTPSARGQDPLVLCLERRQQRCGGCRLA